MKLGFALQCWARLWSCSYVILHLVRIMEMEFKTELNEKNWRRNLDNVGADGESPVLHAEWALLLEGWQSDCELPRGRLLERTVSSKWPNVGESVDGGATMRSPRAFWVVNLKRVENNWGMLNCRPSMLSFFFVFIFLETVCVAQSSLEFMIFSPQPLKCWGYRCNVICAC